MTFVPTAVLVVAVVVFAVQQTSDRARGSRRAAGAARQSGVVVVAGHGLPGRGHPPTALTSALLGSVRTGLLLRDPLLDVACRAGTAVDVTPRIVLLCQAFRQIAECVLVGWRLPPFVPFDRGLGGS